MEQEKKEIEAINDRINAIRAKQENNDFNKNPEFSDLALVFQVPIELVSGVLVGAGMGYILDKLFDFKSVLLVVFTMFGGIAGLVNIARSLKNTEDRDRLR